MPVIPEASIEMSFDSNIAENLEIQGVTAGANDPSLFNHVKDVNLEGNNDHLQIRNLDFVFDDPSAIQEKC
jgi:hypothetical protein